MNLFIINDHVIRSEGGSNDPNIICQMAVIDHIRSIEKILSAESENLQLIQSNAKINQA